MTPGAARYAVNAAALDAATAQIENVLGPRAHPDVEAVIDVVERALATQRRFTAAAIRREARLAALGQYPPGCRSVTYDAGMRRAARIAEGAAS